MDMLTPERYFDRSESRLRLPDGSAKSGIATPKPDMEMIRERLKAAEQIVKELSR